MLGDERETTSSAMSRRSRQATNSSSSVCTSPSSSAIARTAVTYCSYSAAFIITLG